MQLEIKSKKYSADFKIKSCTGLSFVTLQKRRQAFQFNIQLKNIEKKTAGSY